MHTNIVVVQDGKPLDPCSAEDARKMIAEGKITKTAKIWRAPWKNWVSAEELFPNDFGLTGDLFANMRERGETHHQAADDIYSRVLKAVPSAALEELLRRTKERQEGSRALGTEVRIGAKNKEELVQKNIREAVREGAVDLTSLETLIQEYEESGKQRIFLYTLPKAHATALAYENVKKSIFGTQAAAVRFPIFHSLPAEPEASSFRPYRAEDAAVKVLGFTTKHSEGWLLRIDASVHTEERLSQNETDSGIRAVTYAPQVIDAVCVVRFWTSLNLRSSAAELRCKIKRSEPPRLSVGKVRCSVSVSGLERIPPRASVHKNHEAPAL